MNKKVTIDRRLRPLRMAFLVRVEDRESLRKIFEINTCLWGGRFNGIIPIFNRIPQWWGHKTHPRMSINDIVKGYLEAFEPDYVVLTKPEPNLHLSLPKERILNVTDVIAEESDKHIYTGLSVFYLYKDLYEQEFQFVRRDPIKVVYPILKDVKFSLFITACFGDFPSTNNFSFLKNAFKEAFNATDRVIDETNLFETITQGVGTPLWMGRYGLNIRKMPMSIGPVLFFMDATQPRDLIDFWNLRALGWSILPVPKQWSESLIDKCKSFIETHHIPMQENPKIKQTTTLLKSRSIQKQEFESFGRQIQVQDKLSFSLQHWYPRIWNEWARDYDHVQRCEVSAEEGEMESYVEDGWITFRELAPKFNDRKIISMNPEWANVIYIRDYSSKKDFAQVLPPDLKDLNRLLKDYSHNMIALNSEGIVVLSRYRWWTHRWMILDGFSIFKSWLEGRGFNTELSDKGRIVIQLIQSLGGLFSVGLIGHEDILKLLNEMAHGNVKLLLDDSQTAGKQPVRGRIINREKLWGILLKVNQNNKIRAEQHFISLLERRVFRVGMELQCLKCTQRNWYSLEEIADHLNCERCLQEFPFPSSNPPEKAWCYRTQGPFSIEDYAQGSYSVSLALRFFVVLLHAETTWVPNIKMIDSKGKELEFDFGIWWRKFAFDTDRPLLLLGECKSFDKFEKEDLQRASLLAEQFPGAMLVFATLRPNLDSQEKKRIVSLAKKGRGSIKDEKWKTPVMVLTSHELMSTMAPPGCWRDAGGKFAKLAEEFRGYGGLEELCDATQQLHLDMESYSEWKRLEYDKLHLKYIQKKDQPSS